MSYTFESPFQYIPKSEKFGAVGLGKLYIGVINGNPASTPADRIQAYIARQGLSDLAISQPIDISAGGVPTYQGAPVTIKVNAAYSCAVLDHLGAQVYYSPSSGDEITEFTSIDLRLDSLEAKSIQSVETFAALATTAATTAGMVVYLKQHTSGSIGGRHFQDMSGTVTNDGGTVINNTVTAGRHWARVDIENLSIEDFGGIGDGVFDNISVFGSIGASGYKRILIPDNKVFYTSGNFGALADIDYYGSGRVATPTDAFPAKFGIVETAPTIVGAGLPQYFQGNSIYNSNQEYYVQKVGRYGLTQPYFAAEGNPHFGIFDSRSGASGTDAHLAVACPAGAVSATLKYTNAGFTNGTVFVMDDGLGHSQQFTCTGVTGADIINFTPAVTGATFPVAPGFTTVKKANRTQNVYSHVELYHNAGGDGYGQCWRVYAGFNQATAAQYHFFQTSTVGMFNGDISATASGNYLQVSETNIADLGHDVAAIGEVRSYDRTNDTGNRYAFWADRFVKSEGSKKLNFGSVYVGLFDVVHDFGGVTGTDCMIGFAPTQKIYFNNGQNIIAGNPFPIGYGSKGNMFMGSDVTGTVWELTNNTHKLKLSATGALLTPGYVSVGSDIAVPVNKKISLNSSDDLTFFRYDGTNVRLYKNNVVVATW